MIENPTFDEWFEDKNSGFTFEEIHQVAGIPFIDTIRALTREVRDYTSEMNKK